MTDADILRKAREIYAASPSHAPNGAVPTPGTYCVYTALDVAAGTFWAADRVADYIRKEIGWESVLDFNATHSTEEVLTVFDRAIERAEADND